MKFTKLICFLRGHNYKVIEELQIVDLIPQRLKIYCDRCKQYFLHDIKYGIIIKWTNEMEKTYNNIKSLQEDIKENDN